MDLGSSFPLWRRAADQLAARRRIVAAALVGIAVVSGISAARPASPPGARIWVAARNLAGGRPLEAGDVIARLVTLADVPHDALRAGTPITGRLLAAPMREGEPITDVRLLSTALLTALGNPDDVAVPVRVSDGPALLALVRAGDRVDVIASQDPAAGAPSQRESAPAGPAQGGPIVSDVRVLAVPGAGPRATSGTAAGDDESGLVIVAATPQQAAALAQASADTSLSVAVRAPS